MGKARLELVYRRSEERFCSSNTLIFFQHFCHEAPRPLLVCVQAPLSVGSGKWEGAPWPNQEFDSSLTSLSL